MAPILLLTTEDMDLIARNIQAMRDELVQKIDEIRYEQSALFGTLDKNKKTNRNPKIKGKKKIDRKRVMYYQKKSKL